MDPAEQRRIAMEGGSHLGERPLQLPSYQPNPPPSYQPYRPNQPYQLLLGSASSEWAGRVTLMDKQLMAARAEDRQRAARAEAKFEQTMEALSRLMDRQGIPPPPESQVTPPSPPEFHYPYSAPHIPCYFWGRLGCVP